MNNLSGDSFGLIKFGDKSWLKNITEGKIWFRTLEYYRNYEADEIIGDKYEGATNIIIPDKNTTIHYQRSFADQNILNFSNMNTPIIMIPKQYGSLYIFCMSYFSINDIANKTIFDDSILKQKNWCDILFFLEPENFGNLFRDTLKIFNPEIFKAKYNDYTKNQEDLNYFTKSEKYKFQKEIRFIINYSGENSKNIKRIDNNTIEVIFFRSIDSIIVPSSSFRESFYFENQQGKEDNLKINLNGGKNE